jgi:hypothetical protein
MSRFDDEMGEGAGDGIDHYAPQVSADAVAAGDLAADAELRGLAHEGCLFSWLLALPP